MAEQYKEVKDFNNGTASMTLGNDNEGNHLDLGTYVLRLDYEAKNSLQACQLARKVVVGKRALIKKSTARGVYNTTEQNNNSNISDADKLASVCTFQVIVQDKDSGTRLAGIPLKIGFGVGDDTIYDANFDYNEMVAKYNQSKKLNTVFTTNSNGVATITFHVSDFFDSTDVDQIRHTTSIDTGNDTYKHTIYVRLDGTSDRANDDNYVRAIGYVPCVLGYVPVRAETIIIQPEVNGYKVCGGGYMAVGVRLHYDFIYQGNNISPNWEDYPTSNRIVKCGSIYMMVSNDGENYTKLPENYYASQYGEEITLTNAEVPVPSDGQTVLAFRNNKPFNFQGDIWYKIMYRGKVGTSEGKTIREFKVEVDPSYYSTIDMNANIELYGEEEPIMMIAGSGRNVNVGVYDEGDVTNSTPLTHGSLEYNVE